tara:strand:+ start:393 stop:569 length:177 start_codon:yes stop_codon:yes gene_type:complete
MKTKINPKILKEWKREKDLGYDGTVEDYFEEFYGPIPDGFKDGGTVSGKGSDYIKDLL